MSRNKIAVSEVFGPTVQGEGAVIGKPTVFVRTGGCDYRCSWSVTPDTPIMLADLTEVPAGRIRQGDEILGRKRCESNAGETVRGPYRRGCVTAAIRTPDIATVRVSLRDGRELQVTLDHRFVLRGTRAEGRMKAASDLSGGDRIEVFYPSEHSAKERSLRLEVSACRGRGNTLIKTSLINGYKVKSPYCDSRGESSFAVVEDVAYSGISEIVSIETSLGTYVSGGILSRNCDSKFAVLPEYREQWRDMSPEEVFAEVERLSGGRPILVTLSGGNPAIQPLGKLIRLGHERGYTFAIETQGTIHKDWFSELDYLTVSPKPPSSGMGTNWERLSRCLEAAGKRTETTLKVVVFDDADYAYAHEVGERYPLVPIYLQVGNDDPPGPEPKDATEPDHAKLLDRYEWLVGKVLADGWNGATVLPQLHVLLWGNKRGV